jgi:hypothetical protein
MEMHVVYRVAACAAVLALAGCPSTHNEVPQANVEATVEPLPPPPPPSPTPSSTIATSSRKPPPAASGKTLFVAEALVDCEGEGPMKCMRVRASEAEDWTLFYDSIEGFDYQEGQRYQLRVEVRDVANPPADGSSLRYRLLEVVSKTKAEK